MPALAFITASFGVELTNKDRERSTREFALIPLVERSRVQVMCVEEKISTDFVF